MPNLAYKGQRKNILRNEKESLQPKKITPTSCKIQGMSAFDGQNFKEVILLIPQIILAGEKCLQRELDASLHDVNRVQEERQRFQDAISLVQGKWTIDVLYMIFIMGEPSYNQILQALPGVNSRTLTDRLKLLEEKGILHRTLHDARPVRVTYKVSETGKSLIALLLPAVLFCGWPELIKER